MRGQTTIDFAVGVSIFLITIYFVFFFTPSLLAPFDGDPSKGLASTRVSDKLTEDTLTSNRSSRKYIASRECTEVLFIILQEDSPTRQIPDVCSYNSSVDTLNDIVGLPDRSNVNVTIEGKRPDSPIANINGTSLRYGDPPQRATNVLVTQRTIYIKNESGRLEQYRLYVRIW